MANIFGTYGARFIGFNGGHVNILEDRTGFPGIQASFKGFILGTFFEDAFDGLFRLPFYRRIRAEKGSLSGNPAFYAIGRFLVLFFRDVECAQIKDNSVSKSKPYLRCLRHHLLDVLKCTP